jgi:predicted nucleic acid-binding Zn ribbon protein
MFQIAAGNYGIQRFKMFLPWNRGRGIWIRYHNRSGKEYDRYIKAPLSGRFHEFSEKEKFFLETCYHQLFDETGNLVSSKESSYGVPLYHVFENAPTSVLPIYRNFEQDINYFHDVLKKLDEVVKTKDQEVAERLRQIIFEKMFALKDEWKYLPDARKLALSIISIRYEQQVDGNIVQLDSLEVLKQYKPFLEALTRVLSIKDKSLVSFSDFFNQGNLSGLISNLTSLLYTAGYLDAMTNVKKEKFINWLIIGIMAIGFLVLGVLVLQQGEKIDTMSEMIVQINGNMETIKPLIVSGSGIIEPEQIDVINGDVANKPVVK